MKVYVSRDEGSNDIWIWLKPRKGNWKPEKLKNCDIVNYQRESMDEIDRYCCYTTKVFKEKFGFSINRKTVKCVHLPDDLVKDNKGASTCLFLR